MTVRKRVKDLVLLLRERSDANTVAILKDLLLTLKIGVYYLLGIRGVEGTMEG